MRITLCLKLRKIDLDSKLEIEIENITFTKDKFVCIAHLKNIIKI